MRIGVVTTSFPRDVFDYAGSFVAGHVQALVRLGHEVDVVAAGDVDMNSVNPGMGRSHHVLYNLRELERRESERRVVETDVHEVDLREQHRREGERREDWPMVNLSRVRANGLFYRGGAPDLIERSPVRSMFAAASFMSRFAIAVRKYSRNWDHVIAHWLPTAIAALPARKPMTVIAHGGDIHTLRRMRLLRPTLRALRGAKLVFVSEQLRELAGVDGLVQPMGLDLDHFAKLGRAPQTPPIVLCVARLVPIKGIDTAIEAAAIGNYRLVIAGDGPERHALEARALVNARRGAPPVTFLGAVDTRKRDQLLREASVVLVPSRSIGERTEGCPTIALEALAAGVPVIATIGRANMLVPSDRPDELARAIDRVLAAPPSTQHLVADLEWRAVAMRLLRSE